MIENARLDKFLVIDIETVPWAREFAELEEKWQQLWMDKVQRIKPDETSYGDYYHERAGVMAEFSKIICISIGFFHESNFRVKAIYGHNEKELLEGFLQILKTLEIVNNRWFFTGHNIKEFDIPFICRRLLVNGLKIPPYLDFQNMKPWETNIVDTFQYWRFGDYKNFTSLNLLAACLGIESPKSDIDGSKVAGVYYNEGDAGLQRIAKYCNSDVVAVANILLKFKSRPLLEPAQITFVD